jgi:predicted methyltransferase
MPLLAMACVALMASSALADDYDAAIAHRGRMPQDLQRDSYDHPTEILRFAGIAPGMQVADVLGAGGYYSELVSYLVGPTGKVLLVNNAAYDHWSPQLSERLANGRLPNVVHITANLNHMKLPDASLDAVLLVKVFHDLYWRGEDWPYVSPPEVIEQLAKALKPGGAVLLIDHSAKTGTGDADVEKLHRIDETFAIKQFTRRGFSVEATDHSLEVPSDRRDQSSLSPGMMGKTDRFVVLLRKRAEN